MLTCWDFRNVKQAVIKLKLTKQPRTGDETNQYLPYFSEMDEVNSFRDLLRRYNKSFSVPTLKAMQKKMAFHRNKVNDKLKICCHHKT